MRPAVSLLFLSLQVDLAGYLLSNRIIFIGSPVNDEVRGLYRAVLGEISSASPLIARPPFARSRSPSP